MFMPIYNTLVHPHIEYVNQVWSPYLQKDITKLEKIQSRATKLIPALADLPYNERLTKLKLTSLQDRRCRGDMIEVFKIVKGLDVVNAGKKFLENISRNFFQKVPEISFKKSSSHGNWTYRRQNTWAFPST